MNAATGAVFLSYASEDGDAAGRIADALKGAGIDVWFDRDELRGGEAWDRQIRKQIQDCALFIPIISAHSQARLEGYFRREWKLASDRTHDMAEEKPFLVPVVIDDTSERYASVPDRFREVQWTRLPGGTPSPAFVERVERLLGPTPAVESAPPATPRVEVHSAAGWRRPVLVMAAVFILLAMGAYLVIERLVPATQTAASRAVGEKSIAVLPFLDLSEKHDQEYFADGMAEEILDILAKLPSLKVIGRTSSFQFKGRMEDLRAVGASLGVGYVLEGSVRKSADRVRVTAQLIDTRDGTHVWSESYDRPADDALQLQNEIATTVSRSLEIGVGADRPQSERRAKNDAAYDLYLRGRYAAERGDADGLATGATYLRQALDADPGFADAAAALAVIYYDQAWQSLEPSGVFELARREAQAALKLNPELGLAHAVLGAIHTDYDWDWTAADVEYKRAFALAPHDGLVLTMASDLTIALGQLDVSRKMLKQALAYDPLSADAYFSLAWMEWYAGRYSEMLAAARKLIEIDPGYDWGHVTVGLALMYRGKLAEATTEFGRESGAMERAWGLTLAYHALDRPADSAAALRALIAGGAGNYAYAIAEAYAYRGERDDAFRWLDRAYVQKDGSLKWIVGDPTMTKLVSDPRYRAFLQKMKLPG